jgi:hypothetical protein
MGGRPVLLTLADFSARKGAASKADVAMMARRLLQGYALNS